MSAEPVYNSSARQFQWLLVIACVLCSLAYLWGKGEVRSRGSSLQDSRAVPDQVTIYQVGKLPQTFTVYRYQDDSGEQLFGEKPSRDKGPATQITFHNGDSKTHYTIVPQR